MRSHLGGINRNSGIFGADSDTHDKSGSEETLPGFSKGRADRCRSEASSGDEKLAPSTKILVQWIDNKSTTRTRLTKIERLKSQDSHKTRRQKDNGVDKSHDPIVPSPTGQSKLLRKR